MDEYKKYKKIHFGHALDKINIFKRILSAYNLYKLAKQSPDPLTHSISENIAFVIDNQIVDIIHCQPKMAAILLSNPQIIRIEPGQNAKPGWIYADNSFYDPEKYFNFYDPEKIKNEK